MYISPGGWTDVIIRSFRLVYISPGGWTEVITHSCIQVLELFLELLAVRVQLVERSKDVPPDMIEALSSLVYSAQRVQVRARHCKPPRYYLLGLQHASN